MSKTDKTAPDWVRKQRGELDFSGSTKAQRYSWREKGSGPKGVRFAKREASKARRRGINHPWLTKSLTQTHKYNSA